MAGIFKFYFIIFLLCSIFLDCEKAKKDPIDPNSGNGIVNSYLLKTVIQFIYGHRLGGTVSGLKGGTLTLQNSSSGNLSVTANGSFSFYEKQLAGSYFNITILQNPSTPEQICTISNSQGVMPSIDVTNITITCFQPPGTSDSVYVDASAGQGSNTGRGPQNVIDTVNSKVIVVARNGSNHLGLFSCNLDGSNCGYSLVTTSSSFDTSIAIDSFNSKLLLNVRDSLSSNHLSLYRCNLDTTSCSTRDDLSTLSGAGNSSGYVQMSKVDTVNAKLISVSKNTGNSDKLSIFVSALNGTTSIHTDISTPLGQGSFSGEAPSMVFDSVNSKLLIVTQNGFNSDKPSLFRCNFDASSCTHIDISVGQGTSSGTTPFAVIDFINSKLLVVTDNGFNSNKSGLFRCNLDGTSCTYTDISAGQGASSGKEPYALVDSLAKKLLVITRNDANGSRVSLFRCDLDGTNCTHKDVSTGIAKTGVDPCAIIDTITNRLLIFTQDANGKLALLMN